MAEAGGIGEEKQWLRRACFMIQFLLGVMKILRNQTAVLAVQC